jgi:hypothetical protein
MTVSVYDKAMYEYYLSVGPIGPQSSEEMHEEMVIMK